MSSTDKTRPIGVKSLDGNWLEAKHDHRLGPCDLPPRPQYPHEFSVWRPVEGRRCGWGPSLGFFDDRANGCGCPTCSRAQDRALDRRRERHAGREQEREEITEALVRISESGSAVDDYADVPDLWPGA